MPTPHPKALEFHELQAQDLVETREENQTGFEATYIGSINEDHLNPKGHTTMLNIVSLTEAHLTQNEEIAL